MQKSDKNYKFVTKKIIFFQYCMSIKLLCNLEACHVVNFKMTVYLLSRFSEIYLLRREHLFEICESLNGLKVLLQFQ